MASFQSDSPPPPYTPHEMDTIEKIPEIAQHYFKRFYLQTFNAISDPTTLSQQLNNLEQLLAEKKSTDARITLFEKELTTVAYHTSIARCAYAQTNGVNDGVIDWRTMLQLYESMDSDAINYETYSLMLDGCVNAYQSSTDSGTQLQPLIESLWQSLESYMAANDAPPIDSIVSQSAYKAAYFADQTAKYKLSLSAYLTYLCTQSSKNDQISIQCIQYFYQFLERGVTPTEDATLSVLQLVANSTADATEVSRVFDIVLRYSLVSPSLKYFNKYLSILRPLGGFDAAMDVLRLLLFKINFTLAVPDAPRANVTTFENVLYCLRTEVEKSAVSQDLGARKAEWVLRHMKKLKIGASTDLYKQMYETLGVAWWEKLPWHLRSEKRP